MTVAACPRCGCGCHDVPTMPPLPVGHDTIPAPPPTERMTVDWEEPSEWPEEAITQVEVPHPPGRPT